VARLAQRAENELVGAPCGLMDQLTAAYGTHGSLLPILCRPDLLAEPLPLPEGIVVAGWPSGVASALRTAGSRCMIPGSTWRTRCGLCHRAGRRAARSR